MRKEDGLSWKIIIKILEGTKVNLSEKIKELRKQYNLSQEQLAGKIGVSRQAITKWETGGGLPDIENILSIAALFNTSVDELLSAEKLKGRSGFFICESVTEYDIDLAKHYDFNIGDAHEIIVQGSDTEKLKVMLASKLLDNLESKYKVKLDEHKNRIDINLKSINVGKAQTKDALYVILSLPVKFIAGLEISAAASVLSIRNVKMESLEYEGKVNSVQINNFDGHLELDCSCDMEITCGDLRGQISVNQISAASIIHIPSGTDYLAKAKGRSNKLLFTRDGKPWELDANEEADNMIELNGMNSELIINEYTILPAKEGAL